MALLREATEPNGELEQIAISDPVKPSGSVDGMATTQPVQMEADAPLVGVSDPNPDQVLPGDGTEGDRPTGPSSVQDLYPDMPELGDMPDIDVEDPTGAGVTEADTTVGEVGTPGVADTDTGDIIQGAVDEIGDAAEAAQSGLTEEQQVDAELARILGQDSPLLAQARAEAARMANQRGLMNSSMAAGMTYGEMVKAALPMAQQNAQQAFERELTNAQMRQESGLFTAEQLTRLRGLEAELGQELSIFNAEQLNEAERLTAELRTALEQGNQQAYNEAALQLAELQRDAQAQQAEIDYASAEREFLERQAYNEQIIDAVATLNEQFMIGEQQIDIEHVRGTYQQIISTNETAAAIYDSYLSSIGQIMADPKMSSSQAAEAIGYMVDAMEASLRMISEINGIDFRDLGGAVPGAGEPTPTGPRCFAIGTCFRMADGSIKKIEDIRPGDVMELGGRVDSFIVGDGDHESWFDVEGVHVTGSHGVNHNGVWMRVEEGGFDEIDKYDTYYTVFNEHHRMVAENGKVFTDYAEVDYAGTGWDDWVIRKLNGETNNARLKEAVEAA